MPLGRISEPDFRLDAPHLPNLPIRVFLHCLIQHAPHYGFAVNGFCGNSLILFPIERDFGIRRDPGTAMNLPDLNLRAESDNFSLLQVVRGSAPILSDHFDCRKFRCALNGDRSSLVQGTEWCPDSLRWLAAFSRGHPSQGISHFSKYTMLFLPFGVISPALCPLLAEHHRETAPR